MQTIWAEIWDLIWAGGRLTLNNYFNLPLILLRDRIWLAFFKQVTSLFSFRVFGVSALLKLTFWSNFILQVSPGSTVVLFIWQSYRYCLHISDRIFFRILSVCQWEISKYCFIFFIPLLYSTIVEKTPLVSRLDGSKIPQKHPLLSLSTPRHVV